MNNRAILLVQVVAGVVAGFVLAGCDENQQNPEIAQLERHVSSLNENDPESDAIVAFKNEGLKFAGCYNQAGLVFPGVPAPKWSSIRESGNYWTFIGTSDVFVSTQHIQLQKRAWNYAVKYNQEMLRLHSAN